VLVSQDTLTAKYAKKSRKVRRDNQIKSLLKRGATRLRFFLRQEHLR